MTRQYAELSGIRRILVINLAFIGDLLLASPVPRALAERFPEAKIDMLTVPLTEPIAARNPYIYKVFSYDKRGRHKKLANLWQLIKSLRAEKYDLAVSMNFSLRSALVAWATGARFRAGYAAQGGGMFLTHKAPPDRSLVRHETENHLSVLAPLNIMAQDTSLALHLLPEDIDGVETKLNLRHTDKPVVVFCPVGSYPQKSLPQETNIRLLREVGPRSRCFLIGSTKEEPVLRQLNAEAGNVAEILAGTLELGELAALIAAAAVLLTVDTGPMHIAQAVRTPVVAFFGPTDPRIWGPRNKEDVIFYQGLDCSPCWGRTECADIRCMKELPTGEIIQAAVTKIANAVKVERQ